jgi:flagellar protein FlaG
LPFFAKNGSSFALSVRISITTSPFGEPPDGSPYASSVSGDEIKDNTMSNDIQTSAARAAATPVAIPAARSVEGQARPQPPVDIKPAVENKPDPREARRALEEATEQLNKKMTHSKRDLSFSVDDVSNKIVVTVKNSENGEVVRQIPSEVALRVANNLENMKGLFKDEKS